MVGFLGEGIWGKGFCFVFIVFWCVLLRLQIEDW